uniref:KIX domain-containing protein n=1 Tax=Steinernema glaseri TaxID=37863 RepID=A0A1I8A8K3_9BILA
MVLAIYPSPDIVRTEDEQIGKLWEYAGDLEEEIFATSNRRDEYYQRLAKKVYELQRKIKERSDRRIARRIRAGETITITPCPFRIQLYSTAPSTSTIKQEPENNEGDADSRKRKTDEESEEGKLGTKKPKTEEEET